MPRLLRTPNILAHFFHAVSTRLGLVLCLVLAAGIHAAILLLPHFPPHQVVTDLPTVEISLDGGGDSSPGGGGLAQTRGASVTAAAGSATAAASAAALTPAQEPPAPVAAEQPAPAAPQPTPSVEQQASIPEEQAPAVEQPAVSAPAAGAAATDAPVMVAAAAPGTGSAAAGGGDGTAARSGPAGSGSSGSGSGAGDSGLARNAGLVSPRPLAAIRPAYPRAARTAGWEGVVRVSAVVDEAGTVVTAEVVASSGHAALDAAALEAVRETIFTPAVQDGAAVTCRLLIPIRFQLR